MSGERLIAAATRIGDGLLERAVRDAAGWYWETPRPARDPGAEPEVVLWENLYSGASGVALFLAELFRLTREERFLNAAEDALRWAAARMATQNDLNRSFVTGRAGIAAAVLRVAEVAGRPPVASAAEIALGGVDADDEGGARFDWLGGAAGTLWGMCNLYGATGDPRFLDRAGAALEALAAGATLGRNGGLGWLEPQLTADALCGFSHGASGVAFALAEASAWNPLPGAAWLTGMAFRHEDQYFVPEWGNWRDLRDGVEPEDVERAVAACRRGDLEHFTRGANMVAWCHGAPGIAAARLRAWRAGMGDHHLVMARHALTTTRRWLERGDDESATLCHGRCGNASLLVEAWRVLGDDALLAAAANVADEMSRAVLAAPDLDTIADAGGKPGLFLGLAGVGYFLLEAADPAGTPSVLAPRLAARFRSPGWSPGALLAPEWAVARSTWPCSTRLLEAGIPAAAARLSAAVAAGAELREAVRTLVDGLPADADSARIREAWELDEACRVLLNGRVSNTHTAVEAHVNSSAAHAALEDGVDLDAWVRWSAQIALRPVHWPWERVRAGDALALDRPEQGTLLLRRTSTTVELRRLGPAEAAVLGLTREGARIEDLLDAAESDGVEGDAADVLATLLMNGELVLAGPVNPPGADAG